MPDARGGRTGAKLFALGLGSLVAFALGEAAARLVLNVREIGPSFSVFDPVLGKRHKPSFSAIRRTPEFTMRLTTNSRGQRGPEPPDGALGARAEVLFVGDSFTEGYGVDDGEEFPRLVVREIERTGRGAVVTNEGIGDTGTGRALRLVRARSEQGSAPTVLVYQFSSNDFEDDLRDGFFRLDPQLGLVEAPLPLRATFLRRVQPLIDSVPLLSRSYLFAALVELARNRGGAHAIGTGGAPRRVDEAALTLRLIAAILEVARARAWPAIVLVADAPREMAAAVEAAARAGGAEAVVVPPKRERPDLYYRIDGHWNAAGHREVAARLVVPITRALDALAAR